ncbi:lipopolysaccharide cholinephosphotransferase [Selenomonas sp. GACV-9]|uniref:LicD family protein n=1 Tax=Selenomonas sp. GACV-9 TaxID=3158782 RepID=UPI0008ED3ED1|nr:lipopolysaccharide cholinephosphotransferase [Selenomonas ruminantium]
MNELSMQEIKDIQIQIMDEVVKYCDENNIKYWLDSGTMLGAIRHKGYIPWDDDIDIGMLREDYDRFIHTFNEKSKSKYILDCVEINPMCRFPFAKVFDCNTVLYEEDIKLSVNIDVFVFDNAPKNIIHFKWMCFKRNVFNRLNACQYGNGVRVKNKIKYYIYKAMRPLLNLFPKNYFARKVVENSRSCMRNKSDYIGDFTSVSNALLKKEYVKELVKVDFENKKYNVPSEYDCWLKKVYGNYMEFPPEEERVGKHKITAYRKYD